MLVLTRKLNQRIYFSQSGGDPIIIEVVDVQRDRARLAITAPSDVSIAREELIRTDESKKKFGVRDE